LTVDTSEGRPRTGEDRQRLVRPDDVQGGETQEQHDGNIDQLLLRRTPATVTVAVSGKGHPPERSAILGGQSLRNARRESGPGGRTGMDDPRRILVVGYPAAELLDIACVMSTLQIANYVRNGRLYNTQLASPGGRPVHTATGVTLHADLAVERAQGPLDTIVVSGGLGYRKAMNDHRLLAHVRRLSRESRRVASVCTGAGLLARAGLLDGRRAATHWDHAGDLARQFPRVEFDQNPLFVTDGPVATSAGVTAALDLTLSFIEADHGPELARAVARQLVTYMQRPGSQSQMSMFTAGPPTRNGALRKAIEHIEADPSSDLTTGALSDRLGVSERHLNRLFVKELGMTPGRFVRRSRAAAAARLLTDTDLTVQTVATRCGFGSAESLRQAFQGLYGVSPAHYRASLTACQPSAARSA
jgi:transcriptional regulator GlxA family with amidase domain